jgi:GNAT superfamily N-acetyltransferase
MMTLFSLIPPADLLAFLAAGVVLNLTPGADVIFATACGVAGGPRVGAVAGLGVGFGGLFHVGLAAVGVSALIAAHPLALLQQSEHWLHEIAASDAQGVLVWDRDGIAGVAVLEWAYPGVVYLINLGVAQPGKGVGRALIAAVQDHVFGTMGAHRMYCDIAFDNAAALAAFAKAGFTQEGTMRECSDRG